MAETNTKSPPKIGLVGHCGPDGYMLRSTIKYALKDAEINFVNDSDSLSQAIESGTSVLLVNRLLDYGFDIRSGVELIRELKTKSPNVKLMLISDFPDAQSAAEQAGAIPGFGKSEVGSARVKQILAGLSE